MIVFTGLILQLIIKEKFNLYLKEVVHYIGIKKKNTFHKARQTFVSTATLSNGMPIETVSKLLGHSKNRYNADLS